MNNREPAVAPEKTKPKINPTVKPVQKPLPEHWSPELPKVLPSPKAFLIL